ncbi:unnamed protein product [Effrenium voratum]|nr:unnamed protein product [Effrenium voratum]
MRQLLPALALLLAQSAALKADLSRLEGHQPADVEALPVGSLTARWATHAKHLADVEDLDYFWGMPRVAWVIVLDIIALLFYLVGMRVVTSLARKKPEQEEYLMQGPV